jgi:predicted amidohydrolase YtcJ
MAENNDLNLRLWAMARHSSEDLKDKVGDFRKVGIGNDFYTCRAIKSEVDGALGAFGAWLLKPYADKPGFHGQNTTDIYEVKKIADIALENDMQLCVHAIGDRANKVVLDIFENSIQDQDPNQMRWRMEHAQHLDTADIPRFKEYGIIASMQGIHCTSDAPFVEKRLGYERAKYGAYPWRSLLDAGVVIANGTDAPVEDVDPIESYYASVTRKRIDNGFEFFPEQSMTREEAIYSYTLGNAFAAFEEDIKGSIEIEKYADIVILSKNLITCEDEEILDTKILYTLVNGEIKYNREI